MSRESMQTLADPLLRRKMPLFDGTMASVELSKPQTVPGFLGKQKLQYSGACFTYEPPLKDGAGFSPPWSNSKTSPLDDRSPVSHLPGMVLPNHVLYRKDGISAEESLSRSSPTCHAPVKKGFMPYTKSPEISSPAVASPVIIRKPIAGGESSPSPSQTPVYIAIPKPVYGLNPCCNELGCVIGQRYGMEHVSPRMTNDWMQTNGHYAEKPPAQRNEALLQQKEFECSAEQLKRMTAEAYSPNRARTLPSVMEPSYSGYPCAPTRSLFGSLREHSSRSLQTPPGLYASRPTYEHKASEVYQECSPMSKYGHLAQHPVFYCTQANGEVESRTQKIDGGGRQGESVRVFHKHPLSNPPEHYAVPRTHHRTDIPLSCNVEMLPSHSLIRGFDYPCYALPGFHNQIQAPFKRQHSLSGFHPSHINASPTRQHVDHPIAKEKPCAGLHVNQLHGSSSLLRADRISPGRRVHPAAVSPSSGQAATFYQPFASLQLDAPVVSPAGVHLERLLDRPCCEAQARSPKGLPVPSAAWLHRPPGHASDRIRSAAHHDANVRKIIYSPAAVTGCKHEELVSPAGSADYEKSLKRRSSRSSPPVKIKEEEKDLYEVECTSKRQKVEKENVKMSNKTNSPPMPVINNVFSLAPYQSQLHELRVLNAGRGPQKSSQRAEQQEDELGQSVKEKRPDQNDPQPVCLVFKETSNSPADKNDIEVFDPKRVKVEKVDLSDECKESQNTQSKVTIKKEPKDVGSPDSLLMLLKEKRKSNEPESKLLQAGAAPTTDELKPAEVTTQINPSPQEDMLHKQAVTLQPQSVTLHPAKSKVSFKSIPPHCLKLSTYNIILPDGTHCRTLPHAEEKPPPQPMTVIATRQDLQTPVRKHFLELHQSLCKLISDCVAASPEQNLKSWFSKLEIAEPAHQSDKVQKVSCLLGGQAREAWINEEIRSALGEVLERLREYAAQRRCPFPHVMRTGAVFLPMLVVKEQLFPMVQSGLIDGVLQEHKVELRPTTLSEEKILIQLHKRACSSRLRRLMSLKHLPDIYSETLNLLYYTCVCKHLGLNVDPVYKDQDGRSEVSNSSRAPAFSDATASPGSPSEPPRHRRTSKQRPPNKNKTKSRVKSSSRRGFLDKNLGDAVETRAESADLDNSWTRPLAIDELSPSDAETENSSGALPDNQPSDPQVRPKPCSGMILKLRKMLGGNLKRKKACYEAVSESGTLCESSLSNGDVGEEGSSKTPKVTYKWKGKRGFSRAFRPLGSASKANRRSLLKIKYCPYLSACHSAEQRRRWVLRSAVRRARGAMTICFPDLVGKRIRHLYEEDDKSEVWYRGEVLRVHEAHANPLKTIFEVRYDSEPEWKYYLELLIDYKKGWLKIED